MGFAEEFIEAFQVGQQHQDQKLQREHMKRRMQYEEEDRVIEKDLLQHRLRELKIGEKIQARNLARENIQELQGTPTADLTPEMTEGGVLPASSPTNPASLITLMKQMKVPGVEELGVEGYSARPQTMEQVNQASLAQLLQKNLIEQRTKVHDVAPGAAIVQDGQELYRNPREEKRVWPYDRDAKGKTVRRFVTEEEAAARDWEVEPMPRQGSTTINVSNDDLSGIAEAIMRGERPADLSGYRGQDRIRIDAILAQNRFNTTRAIQDQKAVATNLSTLNSQQVSELRINADALDAALADLETANEAWDRTSLGPMSWANILIAKGRGGEAAAAAKAVEESALAAAELLATVKANGSATTNQQLEDARRLLSAGKGKDDLKSVIERARTAVNYRVAAIRGLEAITTEREAAGGGAPAPGNAAVSAATASAAVPAEVSAALKAEGAGRYTLSDGSVWIKDASGKITAGR